MMVVDEDDKRLVEVAVIRKPLLEQKSYVIVKNHVRELPSTAQSISRNKSNDDMSSQRLEDEDTVKMKKYDEMREYNEETSTNYVTNNAKEIDPRDLQELRSVYMQCKSVMERIEARYGHLLDNDNEDSNISKRSKRRMSPDGKCFCKSNKKIVFDDEGRQSTIDMTSEKHICVQKIMDLPKKRKLGQNIDIEYQEDTVELPNSVKELLKMLRNSKLANTQRNSIIDKIRYLKQEYYNELKFNKHILIEKLKTNPDDMIDFKGSNLSEMTGYE